MYTSEALQVIHHLELQSRKSPRPTALLSTLLNPSLLHPHIALQHSLRVDGERKAAFKDRPLSLLISPEGPDVLLHRSQWSIPHGTAAYLQLMGSAGISPEENSTAKVDCHISISIHRRTLKIEKCQRTVLEKSIKI